MLAELLPSPEMHEDWRSYARALTAALENLANASASGAEITYITTTTPVSPDQLPPYPAGIQPVWLNSVDSKLYMGNSNYDPPTAPNIVFIDTGNIADAAIQANKIATAAVTNAKLFDGAVDSLKLASAAVTNAKVASNAIGSANIIDASIVNAKIGTAAVLAANIQDGTIINAKIADGTILNAKIADATILGAKIANATIVTALIGDAQIVSAKIGALQVNTGHIANAAIDSAKIANLAVGSAHIQLLAVTSALIADGAVTNLKIGNVIQSSGWNAATKQGWNIDKTGLIQGSGIAIYDTAGNLVFGSGGTVAWSAITGFSPGGTANRVSFARFELGGGTVDQGWIVTYNPSALNNNLVAGEWAGKRFLKLAPQFTANSQTISVGGTTDAKTRIPLQGGERLSIQYRLEVRGKPQWMIAVRLNVFDSAGTFLASYAPVADITVGGSGNITYGTLYQGFVGPIHANAVYGFLEYYVYNNAGGANTLDPNTWFVAVIEPMVASAQANQTGHPPFVPGPNGFTSPLTAGTISTYIAAAAIGTALIANLAVGSAQIADLSVTTAKIGDLQVGGTKIANNAITTAKIQTGTIIASHFLTDQGVDLGSIVNGSLNTAISATQGAEVRIPVSSAVQNVQVVVLSVGSITINGAGDTLFANVSASVPQGTNAGSLKFQYSVNGGAWTDFPGTASHMQFGGGATVASGMKYWPAQTNGSTVGPSGEINTYITMNPGETYSFRILATNQESQAGGSSGYGNSLRDFVIQSASIRVRRFFAK